MTTYFEDVAVGDVVEYGEHTFTGEGIVAFAEEFDPQPFHVDEAAAAESPYSGLIASGWHTASVCMRLLVEGVLSEWASMGARGLEELTWHHPVRPGDTLSIRSEILDTWPSESKSDRGYVRWKLDGINQDDEVVLTWVAVGMVARRSEDE
jgi:acyl dehydratase